MDFAGDAKKRLRRTMLFLSAQRPGLMKDAYVYGPDSVILDLEDAVAENQKDAARVSLYHNLRSIDYGVTERIVRINGLDTPHWTEDVRVCVAGGFACTSKQQRSAEAELSAVKRTVSDMATPLGRSAKAPLR